MSEVQLLCPECGELFTADEDDGYGECPSCGHVINIEIIDEDWEYDAVDDVPEGCAACGGDYPNCTVGCPLFDD